MSSTYATEVNIQAVSPELILSKPTSVGSVGAGAAAGAAPAAVAVAAVAPVAAAEASVGAAAAELGGAGALSAQMADVDRVSNPRQSSRDSLIFKFNSPVV